MTPRAKPLPPDERRQAIIDATRPLLAELGPRITTKQIAEAAGIAEGTLFRVFDDKAELILAVIDDALDPHARIAAIRGFDQPTLAARASAILELLCSAYAEISRMYMTLYTSFPADGAERMTKHRPDFALQQQRQRALHEAIVDAIAPFSAELSTPTTIAASLLTGLAVISQHGLIADGFLTDVNLLTGFFLHGVSTTERSS